MSHTCANLLGRTQCIGRIRVTTQAYIHILMHLTLIAVLPFTPSFADPSKFENWNGLGDSAELVQNAQVNPSLLLNPPLNSIDWQTLNSDAADRMIAQLVSLAYTLIICICFGFIVLGSNRKPLVTSSMHPRAAFAQPAGLLNKGGNAGSRGEMQGQGVGR